jgi:hypothetical protein
MKAGTRRHAGTAFRAGAAGVPQPAELSSLAGRRRHLHRCLHRPGRCQHRPARPAHPAGDRLPHPAGHRRKPARRQQHRHPGEDGAKRPTRPCHRLFHRRAGHRRQRRTRRGRAAARLGRLAMGVLGVGALLGCGRRAGLAGPAAHGGHRRRDVRLAGRPAPDAVTAARGAGVEPAFGLAPRCR